MNFWLSRKAVACLFIPMAMLSLGVDFYNIFQGNSIIPEVGFHGMFRFAVLGVIWYAFINEICWAIGYALGKVPNDPKSFGFEYTKTK